MAIGLCLFLGIWLVFLWVRWVGMFMVFREKMVYLWFNFLIFDFWCNCNLMNKFFVLVLVGIILVIKIGRIFLFVKV